MSLHGLLGASRLLPVVLLRWRQVCRIISFIEIYLIFSEQQEAAALEKLKNAIGAECYDYSKAKMDEMEKKSNSTSDAELCENKFVIDMTSVRFKNDFKIYLYAAYGKLIHNL